MRYEVSGSTMQTVSIDLERGEKLYSQTATMAWMSDTIRMSTHTGGGLFAGLKRALAGGGLFITEFESESRGHIAFAPRFPGQIVVEQLLPGQSLICRKETFLCAESAVQLDIAFQRRFGAGVFGGDGFILQRVTGPGTAFMDLSGEVVQKTLAPGERLLVHAGHIGMMEPSVSFDIQLVRGFSNILFAGEGLFLATLTGPGRVWLQSMPIMNLAEEIGRYLPGNHSGSDGGSLGGAVGGGVAGVIAGGLLGGILGNE